MYKKNPTIGIIAEDDSDVICARVFIHRITNNNKIKIKKWAKNGCSMMIRKCKSWANDLHNRGCSLLIVIHDSDGNNPNEISKKINEQLSSCPIIKKVIVIPVQELEAWLLSDPDGIKKALKLKRDLNVKSNTESIDSPKEYLGKAIDRASNFEKIYTNTMHNEIISNIISIDIIKKKCPSFVPFYSFITTNIK